MYFYAVYCTCNFVRIITMERPKLWTSSMARCTTEMTLSFCTVSRKSRESMGAFLWDDLDQDH